MADLKIPRLIAHRGNAAEFPENTLPALKSALDLGALYVEFDVQLSADHVPIVLHDANLARTAGIDRNALEMTWAELSHTMVNEASRFGSRFSDVGVPSLGQVVEVLARFPQVTALVELKRSSLRKFGVDKVVPKVWEMLKAVAAQVVVISFDLPALDFARRFADARIGWVISDYSSLTSLKAEAIRPNYLLSDHQILPAGASRLWRGPWKWGIYEVARPELALELANRGVEFIETMEVRSMLRQFRHLQTKHDP